MVLTSHWPFSSLSQVLQTWKGGDEAMASLSGDAAWRQNWGGHWQKPPQPPTACYFSPAAPEGPRTQALACHKLGELCSGKQGQREQGCGRDGANWSKRFHQLETVALGKLSPKEPWEALRVWLQFGSPREDTAEPPLKQSQKSTEWINHQ